MCCMCVDIFSTISANQSIPSIQDLDKHLPIMYRIVCVKFRLRCIFYSASAITTVRVTSFINVIYQHLCSYGWPFMICLQLRWISSTQLRSITSQQNVGRIKMQSHTVVCRLVPSFSFVKTPCDQMDRNYCFDVPAKAMFLRTYALLCNLFRIYFLHFQSGVGFLSADSNRFTL